MFFKKRMRLIIEHCYVLYLLIVNVSTLHFVMYETEYDEIKLSSDCLHYYVMDNIIENYDVKYRSTYQIITYCLRPYPLGTLNRVNASKEISNMSFADMKRNNVTSEQLYMWSAPIDLIEDYQWYLDRNISGSLLFYNCTPPWFGSVCQYAFESDTSNSVDTVVKSIFLGKGSSQQAPPVEVTWYTCYIFITCTRPSKLCLDWREVCDGLVDCDEGTDEIDCWQLEIAECSSDQYRCHNGMQCISINFLNDDTLNGECLDFSDEQGASISIDHYSKYCLNDPSFRCEERVCNTRGRRTQPFVCGDGQCAYNYRDCINSRDGKLLDGLARESLMRSPEYCANFAICLTNLLKPSSSDTCDEYYREFCRKTNMCRATGMIFKPCPSPFIFPVGFSLFGHVRFGYDYFGIYYKSFHTLPHFLCFKADQCPHNPVQFETTVFNSTINGVTFSCFSTETSPLVKNHPSWFQMIHDIQSIFSECYPNSASGRCHKSLYKCVKSTKCISKHRLKDDVRNCPFGDDELDRVHLNGTNSSNIISDQLYTPFETICDGYEDVRISDPILGYIDDESDCAHWPCNNTYSRCDVTWACPNGADEFNCPLSVCSALEIECVSAQNFTKICLPVAFINNGVVDCVGASDEYQKCSGKSLPFYCLNTTRYCIHNSYLCDGRSNCPMGDDEGFCERIGASTYGNDICLRPIEYGLTKEEDLICTFFGRRRAPLKYFLITNLPAYPDLSQSSVIESIVDNDSLLVTDSEFVVPMNLSISWYCNRGLRVRMRNEINESFVCLCPPAYFGHTCEYQSQRVSLTARISTAMQWKEVFAVVFTLIGTNKTGQIIIHSQEQIEYLGIRDCNTKFNINLLYATRPKEILKTNYSVQIDAYIKTSKTIKHHSTWRFPILFSFLPINRMAFDLTIHVEPNASLSLKSHCDRCAPESHCLGRLCICPLGKVGPRCLLSISLCHSNPCKNGGTCVPKDLRIAIRSFVCICPMGFSGQRCQLIDTRIDISFEKRIDIPENLFLHFIEAVPKFPLVRSNTFKKIPVYESSTSVYHSRPFHLVFAEFYDKYYLLIIQKKFHLSRTIVTIIRSSHQCIPLRALLNDSIVNQILLRRMKFYHIPCQKNSDLICFYDGINMCLCDLDRHANCFLFNDTLLYKCQDEKYCENGGRCFQDDSTCPTMFLCSCPSCFYGSRCQFSSKSIGISLDAMLGYHIIPYATITQQPFIIRISITITIIMFFISFSSSFLSIITFRNKTLLTVGCHYYLFGSTITSFCTMTLFNLKLFFLLVSQMELIKNRTFLLIHCISIDFLLRIFLNMNDWLHACVAIERVVTVIKGINFSGQASRRAVKWIIVFLILFTTLTNIQEPFHRNLLDDLQEKRTWCIVSYSSLFGRINSALMLFNFLAPFTINLVSASIIIITTVRRRKIIISQKKTNRNLLGENLRQHKFLFISPLLLIILALPRLIISLLPDCMETVRKPWLFLIAYWCSYIPSMFIFPIFVLPSDIYRKAFKDAMKRLKCNRTHHC
jgi:hypothetical protein